MRLDTVLSDIERRNVRQRAFQAVTDLNEHLSVYDKDKQHDAITPVLLADAPHLRDALRVIRDVRVTLHFRKHSNHNLVRSVALKLGQLLIEAISGFLRNDASVIIKVAVACEPFGSSAANTAMQAATCLTRNRCSGSRVGCSTAGDTPATRA